MNVKKRNIILSVGLLLLIWFAYQFSFSKTINARHNYNNLIEQEALFTSISQNIVRIKQQQTYYNTLLDTFQISTQSSFQNNLLKAINDYSKQHGMKIINFKDPHRFQIKGNAVQETFIFTVESDFNSIINLVYRIEQQYKFGKIISIGFEKKKNYRTRSSYLQCTLFLQKITEQ